MAQSVSNDALWEKLSELNKKLEHLSEILKTSNLEKTKDEIVTEIQEQISLLGKHGDINFGAINQNIGRVDETIRKILNIISHIRKHQREAFDLQKAGNSYFNFIFFKVRKTTIAIAVLGGLLVFILILFYIVDR